jgi:hypothetical protein
MCANGGVTTPCVAIMTSVEWDAVANKDKQKLSGDILGNPYILLKPAVIGCLDNDLSPSPPPPTLVSHPCLPQAT